MSETSRLRAYRACVNLPEAMNGHLILIDDTDPRWADRIKGGLIAAVGPPPGYEPPSVPVTRATAGVTDLTRESRDDSTYEIHISEQSEQADPEDLAARGLDPA